MNYIAEIKRFYDRQLSEHLSAGQIALWHALMEISNRNGWQEWFSAPVETLMLFSGLSRSSVYDAVKHLISSGFIERDNHMYKIRTDCRTDCRTNPDSHLIYNKTKLNETKLNQRKGVSENGKTSFRADDAGAIPGGIKL